MDMSNINISNMISECKLLRYIPNIFNLINNIFLVNKAATKQGGIKYKVSDLFGHFIVHT